jgi:hypothetical protein
MRLLTIAVFGVALLAQTRTILPPSGSLSVAQQVTLFGEPLVVLNAEKAWLGADAFWPLARTDQPVIQRYAVRALGRLEDPANVAALVTLAETRLPSDTPGVVHERRTVAADAVAQSLYGFDPQRDPKLIADVADWFLSLADLDPPSSLRSAASPTRAKRSFTPRSGA